METRPTSILEPKRILIRSVNWLGDAVMTTPALLRVRDRFPHAKITLLCPSKLADLWKSFPGIDRVQPFSPRDSLLSITREIRKGSFNLGILLPNSTRSALEMWMGGVTHRVGYGANGRSILLTHPVRVPDTLRRMRKRRLSDIRRRMEASASREHFPESAHHIHHYLHLAGTLGAVASPIAPYLVVEDAELRSFREAHFNGLWKTTPRLILGLNPGAEYGSAKRWPAERFADTAVELIRTSAVGCILFGGPGDQPITEEIERGIRQRCITEGIVPLILNLAGRTSLREMMAGVKTCSAFLTNDSGPMHVAAALGTPVVVPFGSTSPDLTSPGLPGDSRHVLLTSSAPCAPCFLRECPIDFRCMKNITTDEVTQRLNTLLNAMHFK